LLLWSFLDGIRNLGSSSRSVPGKSFLAKMSLMPVQQQVRGEMTDSLSAQNHRRGKTDKRFRVRDDDWRELAGRRHPCD
jgi:hypothetical protein